MTREDVLLRLEEWRERVHALYDEVERALQGRGFTFDRQGKHTSSEPLVQAVGLNDEEQPKVDIFRIVRANGTTAAVLYPRGPWVVGANGRIDLRLTPSAGTTQIFMLMDQSGPFSTPFWVRIPMGSPFERERFHPEWLLSKLNGHRSG